MTALKKSVPQIAATSLVCPHPFAVLNKESENAGGFRASIRKLTDSYIPGCKARSIRGNIWNEHFFGLGHVEAFQTLTKEQKSDVLSRCDRGILKEIQIIELAGTLFAAKMSITSETLEERELYNMFAADETRHLRIISQFVGEPVFGDAVGNSFGEFLARIIQTEERSVLVYIIQVILEGWGIRYYTQLAKHAQDSDLCERLKEIVFDEGKHHGCGLLLFEEKKLTPNQFQRCLDLMLEFTAMVKAGPVRVVANLANVAEGLTSIQLQRVLQQMQFDEKIATDLQTLKHLMLKAGALSFCSALDARGAFQVPTLEQCTRQMVEML